MTKTIDSAVTDLKEYLEGCSFSKAILHCGVESGELSLTVRREALRQVLTFLRDDASCSFRQLVDICGVDWPERDERFDVVYQLLSMTHNLRIRIKIRAAETTPVDTVTDIFSSAGWFEREVWDMYGVSFSGNPDLRRILTDYGFEGHPLRKDFPLTGFVELRYDEAQRRIVYEPVKLAQDFRVFDFESPWEGMTTLQLPGDEKARKPKVTAEGKLEEKKVATGG